MLATSAYLASAASTKSLVSAILNKEEWGDAHLDELLEARQNTQPSSAEPIWKQKMWDRPLIESDKAVVSAEYSDPINRARLNVIVIVIVNSKLLKRHSKAKRRAPAY